MCKMKERILVMTPKNTKATPTPHWDDPFIPCAKKTQVKIEVITPITYKTIEAMYSPLRGLTGAEDDVSSSTAVVTAAVVVVVVLGDAMTSFVVVSDPSAYLVVVVLVTLPSAPVTSVKVVEVGNPFPCSLMVAVIRLFNTEQKKN